MRTIRQTDKGTEANEAGRPRASRAAQLGPAVIHTGEVLPICCFPDGGVSGLQVDLEEGLGHAPVLIVGKSAGQSVEPSAALA